MGAYLVEESHIRYLVHAGLRGLCTRDCTLADAMLAEREKPTA